MPALSGVFFSAGIRTFAGCGPGFADTPLETGEPVPGRGS